MPPAVLPRVTKKIFFAKAEIVSGGTVSLDNRNPSGIKNIFATQCSKPMATKAEVGINTAINFPAISCAPTEPHRARQTNQLHSTPRKNIFPADSDTFAAAIEIALSAE